MQDENDIILGSGWMFANAATFSDNGSTPQDPPQSVIASLPGGYHWPPDAGRALVDPGMAVS